MHGSRGGPCKPVLESKWMGEMFQKKGKRFGNLAKNVQDLRIIKKKQLVITSDNCTQWTSKIGPAIMDNYFWSSDKIILLL